MKQQSKPYQQLMILIFLNLILLGNSYAAIVISPTNIFIENNQKNAALWLENRGDKPQTMQVRIFKWIQKQGENGFEEQKDVIASPPIINIAPGKTQLIRVMNSVSIAAKEARYYRLIIDEIPTPETTKENSLGVSFRFRYSVPLFIYGQDIDYKKQDNGKLITHLSWRTMIEKNQHYLEIYNNNPVHIRFEQIKVNENKQSLATGYILPNNYVRLLLPNNAKSVLKVDMTIEDKAYRISKK